MAIKESLDLKAGSKSIKPLVYVKVNIPVTKLDGKYTWPDWAISKSWKQVNVEEYNRSKHLIDPDCTVMPNISAFTERYKAQPRTYLPSIPPGVRLPDGYSYWSTTPAPVSGGNSGPSLDLPHTEQSPSSGPLAAVKVP